MKLKDKWLKASVLGSTWAASEIVLGSFLHNLRVPFSGNILTAIGLILLISASYRWKEKGIIWRAGLITAIMKTASPSAVIFGPMIAIFTEALLLDLSTRALGRNWMGYLVGAVLAMSWVLFQRIFNLILFYGSSLVDLYTSLMKMAGKYFQIESDLVWLPILILLGVHIAMGLLAGIAGIRLGGKLLEGRLQINPSQAAKFEEKKRSDDAFEYSLLWLSINIALVITSLLVLSYGDVWLWLPYSILLILLWTSRYRQATRQISRPKFWIWFLAISLLASFVLLRIQNDQEFIRNGFILGLQMSSRAAVLIIGFSVIGKELYHPRLVNYFQRSRFSQLHFAIKLAFQSIPAVISVLPTAREIIRSPFSVIALLIQQAERTLTEYQSRRSCRVVLVHGDKAAGKTSLLIRLVAGLEQRAIKVGGLVAPRMMQGEETIGYSIYDIRLKKDKILMTKEFRQDAQKIGPFYFEDEGIHFGRIGLEDAIRDSEVIVLDEIGKAELEGEGWHTDLENILNHHHGILILGVRTSFTAAVIEKYQLKNSIEYPVGNQDLDEIIEEIKTCLYPETGNKSN